MSGRVGLAILAGEVEHSMFENIVIMNFALVRPNIAVNERLDVRGQSRSAVFPEVDVRLGFTYRYCVSRCLKFTAEFGYEFTSYVNALSKITFNDERGTNQSDCFSFNLNGFYLNFRIHI